MNTPRKSLYLFGALLIAVVALTFYQMLNVNRPPDQKDLLEAGIVLLPEKHKLPDITLTRQDGREISVNSLRDRWTLIFFGYTFCPDICPTTLADLKKINSQLGEQDRQQLRIIMTTVDPGRDTPEQLKKYLAFFSPDFIGLTGNPASIQALAGALGIPFIAPEHTDKANYAVEHSGNLALIGPDGNLRGFIRAPLQVDLLTAWLPRLLRMR